MSEHSQELLELCRSVVAKRPKTVIDHLLAHGSITTEQLKDIYGYNHPPRAVRDVREYGIPVDTLKVEGSDGRKIAVYRLGELQEKRLSKLSGRTGLSKKIKEALVERFGAKCSIYMEEVPVTALQIDHRVPFEVDGDGNQADDYMLLSASANRAKSWSCEQCDNWQSAKDKSVCLSCYWAYPEKYTHIAGHQIRRVDLMWQGKDVSQYEQLKLLAKKAKLPIPDIVKQAISAALIAKK